MIVNLLIQVGNLSSLTVAKILFLFLIINEKGNKSLLIHEKKNPTELDVMKERFAKLLLGEDMSGSGKGVCTAVTISNAITNLYGNDPITKPKS